ncbi:unnamed protein product [Effrenium voratum]|uniref:Uncharacterized protein n=1 Tax=Effrenium voratum TaxID=2562239 RepID=A0AA36I4J8_9DINO|nr:unnamed protein product [Effrenium voratum]CAJ1419313.1 unnamed protein product [Effrenium voratum]CAJ1460094.1 unnamed protein product [Effrenium voratum]
MLGGKYDDSDSEDHGGKIANSSEEEEGPTKAAEQTTTAEGEESEDSEDEEGGDKLPSASKAFKTLNAMGEEGLSFKKHEKERGKKDRVRMHQMSLDRVTTASAATLRGQGWLPGNDAKQAVLPEEVAGKRPRGDEEEKANESKGQGKGKGKMSVKDLTKLKRFKGQSGLDHNGKTWKPEIWMTMRQEYD